MRNEYVEVEQGFYQRCAELLGTTYTYTPWPSPTREPNRWNNRHAGNGRFEGFGTIRLFSPNCIQISLRHPVLLHRTCKSVEDALQVLKQVTGNNG